MLSRMPREIEPEEKKFFFLAPSLTPNYTLTALFVYPPLPDCLSACLPECHRDCLPQYNKESCYFVTDLARIRTAPIFLINLQVLKKVLH